MNNKIIPANLQKQHGRTFDLGFWVKKNLINFSTIFFSWLGQDSIEIFNLSYLAPYHIWWWFQIPFEYQYRYRDRTSSNAHTSYTVFTMITIYRYAYRYNTDTELASDQVLYRYSSGIVCTKFSICTVKYIQLILNCV